MWIVSVRLFFGVLHLAGIRDLISWTPKLTQSIMSKVINFTLDKFPDLLILETNDTLRAEISHIATKNETIWEISARMVN